MTSDIREEMMKLNASLTGCRTARELSAEWGAMQPRLKRLRTANETALLFVSGIKDAMKVILGGQPA